ncbi:EVE domain-containing protein [Marinomonas algicola]|uniref:EVE domain-containing protein n=1 Tax=Marinomonas algicola TaxID=2773454 RepID=UPI00174B46F6|nr:EVE domain-containing protein [Marinomonas algicola]
MNYWLMKSEPDAFSLENLKAKPTSWDGVRNYQARNHMKSMKQGDQVFFYHSSCKDIGIVGIAQVIKESYPDHTAWNPKSDYFDARSSPENPLWYMVDIEFVREFSHTMTLSSLKESPELANMNLLKRGNRLSVMPITEEEWNIITLKSQYL